MTRGNNQQKHQQAQKLMSLSMPLDPMYEKSIPEGLEALRDWLIREPEFQVIATETIKGLSVRSREPQQFLFGQISKTNKPKLGLKCPVQTVDY